jgi:hypothetical protein
MKKVVLTVFVVLGLIAVGVGAQIYLAPTHAQNAPRDPGPP